MNKAQLIHKLHKIKDSDINFKNIRKNINKHQHNIK